MSYDDGWAALNLDMPSRVPRTEYSAGMHWELIAAVTGIHVSAISPDDAKDDAERAFCRAWDFDFFWSTLIGSAEFGKKRTSMGHAVYQEGGTDYDNNVSAFLSDPEEALAFDPAEAYGCVAKAEITERFEKHYQANCLTNPDGVNMTGIYTTLMSGLIDILGWDMLLLSAGVDHRRFGELTNRYAKWIGRYFAALADADVPVVMVHDDIVWTAGAFIAPEWYREFIFPNYKRFFEPLRASGKKIIYTSDGNYTEFIDDLAACGVDGFVLEPTTDMAQIAEKYGKTHVFIGNADTRILLSGSRDDIRREVERCMDIGKKCPGYFLAVGNHIPPNTPVENALYYNEVYEKLSRR